MVCLQIACIHRAGRWFTCCLQWTQRRQRGRLSRSQAAAQALGWQDHPISPPVLTLALMPTLTTAAQEEQEEAVQARLQRKREADDNTGVSVSDADMAAQLSQQARKS